MVDIPADFKINRLASTEKSDKSPALSNIVHSIFAN